MKLVARRADGRERTLADWFPNLITNAGMNRIGAGASATHAWVGSGSRAPQFADADLETPVSKNGPAVTGLDANGSVIAAGYGWFRRTFRFAAGVAAGNLSEVAIGWNTTSGMFSRALIRDAYDQPTVVTILADEVLDVLYEFRVFWPTSDILSSVTINGQQHAITIRTMETGQWGTVARDFLTQPRAINAWAIYGDAAIGGIDTGASGAQVGTASNYNIGNYLPDSYDAVFRASLGNGLTTATNVRNFGLPTTLGRFKMSVNPMIVAGNQRLISIAMRIVWARRG